MFGKSMKGSLVLSIFFTTVAFVGSAYAQPGGSGGGDIQCDAQVKRLTGHIKSWVEHKGPDVGTLDLSSSVSPSDSKPYTVAEYDSNMDALLSKPLDVSCVGPGQPGYPVEVGDAVKICKSSVDARGFHMTCDRNLLLSLNDSLMFQQINHEFAIHIPGLEPDTGPISTYKISQQLSPYVSYVREPVLLVRAPDPVEAQERHPNSVVKNSLVMGGSWFDALPSCIGGGVSGTLTAVLDGPLAGAAYAAGKIQDYAHGTDLARKGFHESWQIVKNEEKSDFRGCTDHVQAAEAVSSQTVKSKFRANTPTMDDEYDAAIAASAAD